MQNRIRFLRNRRLLSWIVTILLLISGFLCLIFTEAIRGFLPYIAIGLLLVLAFDDLYEALGDREYTPEDAREIANAIVYVALAGLIFVKRQSADYIIGAAWGMLGLVNGAEKLSPVLHSLFHQTHHLFRDLLGLLVSFFGITISLLLLTDPSEHLAVHVFILGLELINSSLEIIVEEHERAKKEHEEQQ